MEIYWFSGSAPSWRVLLTLAIKGVRYDSRLLNVSQGDLKTPYFLAINPRGKVSALRDGDFVLTESLAIMVYLDRAYPDPPLFGGTAAEAGRVWEIISASESYFQASALGVILPIFIGSAHEKATEVRAAAAGARNELAVLEAALEIGDSWLAGGRVSAADIAVYPYLEGLLRAAGKDAAEPLDLGLLPFAERYPALAAWRERVATLPGYDEAYPPHWREAA